MDKPKIAIKLRQNDYDGISTLAGAVLLSMNANPNFINPQPSLATLQAATIEMRDAITQWGTIGHRGSHADRVNLTGKAMKLHGLLTALGAWCMSTVDPEMQYGDQAAILLSSGFPLRKQRAPQGMLAAPEKFRQLIQKNLSLQQVKLKWAKPLMVAVSNNVKSYKIYRSASPDFDTAANIDLVQATSYIDQPGAGVWYYWVVAVNNKGDGVKSEMIGAGVPAEPAFHRGN